MTSLREKLNVAKEQFKNEGTARLNIAKARAERALIQASECGDRQVTLQVGSLFRAERAAFEQWLRAEGIKVEYVVDQRDGDYYYLTIDS